MKIPVISSIAHKYHAHKERKEAAKDEKFYVKNVQGVILKIQAQLNARQDIFANPFSEKELKNILSKKCFELLEKPSCPFTEKKKRRFIVTQNGLNLVLWNREADYELMIKGRTKKVIYASDLHSGCLYFGLSMPSSDAGVKRQQLILQYLSEKASLNRVLKKFVLFNEDTAVYTNKKNKEKFISLQKELSGDLRQGMQSGKLTGQYALQIFSGLIEGFAALHEAGVIVRDVKPANILIDIEKDKAATAHINDFDLACNLHADTQEEIDTCKGNLKYSCADYLQGMLSRENALDKQDIWAVGMILYKLFMNKSVEWLETLPKENQNMSKEEQTQQFFDALIKGGKDRDAWFPKELRENPLGNLIYNMLSPSFAHRLSMTELWEEFQERVVLPKAADDLIALYEKTHAKPTKSSSKEEVE